MLGETTKSVAAYPAKPYTRWWWFSGPLDKSSIEYQLEWMAANGFGGVEIAWIYPLSTRHVGPKWLDYQWQSLVAIAKQCCDRHGLGCDFTFGTLWPFGGSFVRPEDASWTFDGPSEQRLEHSWEHGVEKPGRIINHLSRRALEHYAATMGGALANALQGSTSALFCDSWEVDTSGIWSPGLWEVFEQQFGYSLLEYKERLEQYPEIRYDYRRFLSQVVVDEFYKPFTGVCHSLGALSRVQCHGAPTDLLAAYAAVDMPETEALLFPTTFARIPASAAVLAAKPVVSSETFTCMYGFPAIHQGKEQIADLKLLADSVFAHGVNHIIWHGTPFNPIGGTNRFFATVHVGQDSAFADCLLGFNRYLEKVCKWMRSGKAYTNLAVYFPLEDNRMLDELPKSLRTPAARYYWEMRYAVPPQETEGYHPIWVSLPFLKTAMCDGNNLIIGTAQFNGLYVDCDWLDIEALQSILRLARAGLPVVMTKRPHQPGKRRSDAYVDMLDDLLGLRNVANHIKKTALRPFIEGDDLPFYWARYLDDSVIVFFAHPKAKDIAYPMRLGQSFVQNRRRQAVALNAFNRSVQVELDFEPYQSLLIRVNRDGTTSQENVHYDVPHPSTA
jgi:hypothetical protein